MDDFEKKAIHELVLWCNNLGLQGKKVVGFTIDTSATSKHQYIPVVCSEKNEYSATEHS